MPYDPDARFEVSVQDVEYLRRGDTPLLARMYQPEGVGPFPGLIDVHGGQWSAGTRENNVRLDRVLAESGIVVLALDFRLAPDHPYPAQLQDINYGVRWLKAHAAEYRVDPAMVGGLGASSGGHGIVLTAMRPHDARYAALPSPGGYDVDASLAYVVSCWGIVDPYARLQFALADPNAGEGRGGPERLQRSTLGYFLTEGAMLEGNPQRILDRGEPVSLPPLLVVQGDQDKNIPYTIPQRFAEAWRMAGGHSEFRLFAGVPHNFANEDGPQTAPALAAVRAFIVQQLAAVVADPAR
jgi:acetyl esterase/lipase